MIKVLFILLRTLTAIGALVGLAGTLLVFFVGALFELIKGGIGIVTALTTLIASGFQKSPATPEPSRFPFGLAGLALMFLAMFASVFLPEQKIFLHVLAAGAGVAAIWRIWIMATVPGSDVLYLPIVVLWFVYYLVCLRRM